jgi:ATP/maltotriose-dependent transcriptional regulator MalT/AmiR/NasT family two-component response regulator
MKTRILLVDDHPFTRKGIQAMINTDKSLEVIGEAVDGQDAIVKAVETEPDIIIMDITMPNMSGIEATSEILKKLPSTKIITLSIHSGPQFVQEMLDAGASGYLLKDEVPEELIRAIKKVSKGEMFLSSVITRAALDKSTAEKDQVDIRILKTKLHKPPVTEDYITRQRVIDQLENNIARPLSLISAGAGYGKSVAVSEWLDRTTELFTWLSIDEEHNDLRTFLLYLQAAIEKLFPGSLKATGEMINAGDMPPFKVIYNILINELFEIDKNFILVIDDYHLIHEDQIHQLIDEWIRFPPPNIHLSIITRRDPPLNLRNLRANNRMTEIRMADLSFSDQEIDDLYKKLLGVDPAPHTISLLHEKTEGWIIGLRFASMIIKDAENPEQKLETLSGDLNSISDYLITEVLQRQPEYIQDQLLTSSVLDRFSAGLIDGISPQDTQEYNRGENLIQWLNQSNLFIISLDDEKEWFRYHHLFQDLLRTQLLKRKSKAQIREIHAHASKWFEKHELITEAIDHAILASDFVRARNIILEHWEDSLDLDLWYMVDGWLKKLPEEIILGSANLLLAQTWIAQRTQKIELVPAILENIQKINADLSETEKGYLAMAKSMISYFTDEVEKALEFSDEALQLIPEKHFCFRADTYGWWAVAMQINGKGEEAVENAKNAIKHVSPPGEPIQLTRRTMHQNFIHILELDMSALKAGVKSFFDLQKISPYMLGWGYYFRGAAFWWANDLGASVLSFKKSIEYRYQAAVPLSLDAYISSALTLQLLDRPDEADQVLIEADQYVLESRDPYAFLAIGSGKARLNLLRGNIEEAEKWMIAYENPTLAPSMLWYVDAPPITYCRVLYSIGTDKSLKEALNLLSGFRKYTEARYNQLRTLEIVLIQTRVYLKMARMDEALNTLKYAVELVPKGEWFQPFIEAGNEIKDTLLKLRELNTNPVFIDNILDHHQQKTAVVSEPASHKIQREKIPKENLVPFTAREMEIIQCVNQGLRTQEIAEKLFNSEGTIKKHIANMFVKMHVRNRLSLVIRARELGILDDKENLR